MEHERQTKLSIAGQRYRSGQRELVRYLLFVNSGGVIATLSFAGATIANGGMTKLIVLPLSLFMFGLIFVGLVYFTQLVTAIDAIASQHPLIATILQRRKFRVLGELSTAPGEAVEQFAGTQSIWMLFSLGCFLLGAVAGVIVILVI